MDHTPDPAAITTKFWRALHDAPVVFLALDQDNAKAVPMRALLDETADSAVWFFTSKEGPLAPLGNATGTYASKFHTVFARFHGTLFLETDTALLDRYWNRFLESWYPGGKHDPNLLLLRMDLAEAEIWDADIGLVTAAKMASGKDLRDDARRLRITTTL